MRLFLVGLPASGKSFYAGKIADHFQLQRLDLDSEIEKNTGLAIAEIFQEKGEKYFRNKESSLLTQFCISRDNFVLATGGGTAAHSTNMALMSAHGLVIYLNPPIDQLVQRVLQDGIEKRPLFANCHTHKDILELLTSLKGKRQPFYEKAALQIKDFSNEENIVSQIENQIKNSNLS